MNRTARLWAVSLFLAFGILFTGCSEKMGTPDSQDNSKQTAVSSFYSPKPEDIVKDPDTGLDVVKDILNITFSKKMDETAIKKVVSSINGEIVGQDKAARLYQVRIKGANLEDIDKLGKQLLAQKGIELTARDTVSVHVDPYYVR